jgi:hypothetical protein
MGDYQMPTLVDLGNISLMIGALVAVLSVVLLFRELRENNKLTRAANTQALVELSAPFFMGLIQDRKMAELYVLGSKEGAEMDEVDRYRYRSLVSWWLVFHENAFYQWRNGLLDAHSYKPWANDLNVFLRQQNVAEHWKEMKILFQDEFARHVTALIDAYQRNKSSNPPPGPFGSLLMMQRADDKKNPEELTTVG